MAIKSTAAAGAPASSPTRSRNADADWLAQSVDARAKGGALSKRDVKKLAEGLKKHIAKMGDPQAIRDLAEALKEIIDLAPAKGLRFKMDAKGETRADHEFHVHVSPDQAKRQFASAKIDEVANERVSLLQNGNVKGQVNRALNTFRNGSDF